MRNKITMELLPQEVDLIQKIREHYRFGKIILETKDGLPYRIEKTVEYDKIETEFSTVDY